MNKSFLRQHRYFVLKRRIENEILCVYSIGWTWQQELHHHTRWPIPSPRSLYAHIQEGNTLVECLQIGLGVGWRSGALHVFLCFFHANFWHSLCGAVERVLAPCARLGGDGAAEVALASRLEDGLNFESGFDFFIRR